MAVQSSKALKLIIFIAITLFVTSIIWKSTRQDNSEKIYVEPVSNLKSVKKNKKEKIQVDNVKTPEVNNSLTEEIQEEATMEALHTTLNLNLMYKTPEDVVKSIEYYESIGDEKNVQIFTDFLLERFPEFNY